MAAPPASAPARALTAAPVARGDSSPLAGAARWRSVSEGALARGGMGTLRLDAGFEEDGEMQSIRGTASTVSSNSDMEGSAYSWCFPLFDAASYSLVKLSDEAIGELLGFNVRWFYVNAACSLVMICHSLWNSVFETVHHFDVSVVLNLLALMCAYLSLKALRSGVVAVMLRDILDHDLVTSRKPWTSSWSNFRFLLSWTVLILSPIVWVQVLWECFHTWVVSGHHLLHLPGHLRMLYGLVFQGHCWGLIMPSCATLLMSWHMCRARIEVVIQQIESRQNLDWDEACELVNELDGQLCKFWRFTSAGGLWSGVLLALLVMFLLALSVKANHGYVGGIIVGTHETNREVFYVWNFAVAFGMLLLAGMLASLTSSCSSNFASRRSIVNASRMRFQVGSLTSDDELIRYRQYMQHLQSKQRGVEIGGLILVTTTRVAMLAVQICVNVPVIFAVLWMFAQRSRPASS